MDKRTKIVCTIGPASSSVPILKKMINAGMNVARLNFSHGTFDTHRQLLKNIRQAAEETGKVISILADLQGPRIRLGKISDPGVIIKKGQEVIFTTSSGKAGKIPVTYNKLHTELKVGEKILIADGVFGFLIKKISGPDIVCEALTPAKLTSNKGMNFPDSKLKISSVSKKDIADLEFGISQGADFVGLSFVRNVDDVLNLRRRITKLEKKYNRHGQISAKIIVKIEMADAVRNFDEILKVTDCVMVARGDLGVELPPEAVPLIQKKLIEKCNQAAKPVIVATQMLDSMIVNPRPTRAEVSDVANAVIDHTDAVMLSGESAQGQYPVEAVQMMAKVLENIEESEYDDPDYSKEISQAVKNEEAIASAVAVLSVNVKVKMIIVLSMTGQTARLISKYRPQLPILVTTISNRVARQLNLTWGIIPMLVTRKLNDQELVKQAIAHGKKHRLIKSGEQIILIKGHRHPEKRHELQSIDLITIQ